MAKKSRHNTRNCMSNTFETKGKTLPAWVTAAGAAVAVMFLTHDVMAVQAMTPLGSADKFAILAATTVTSTGATTVNGNLGVSPGTTVSGSPTVNGTSHLGDPIAAQAQGDLTIAYNDLAGRPGGAAVSGNLGGLTLSPGLYTSTSSLEITSGDLTLDAQGDPNAVFIFQIPTTFITTVGRKVILSGGATACHVFWQVGSSATLGAGSIIKGNILAYTSITFNTGATLDGRALARNGAVALDDNIITTIPSGAPAPSFGSIYRAPEGSVTLIITNTPCLTLTLKISADLTNWTTLTTLTPGASPYVFTDTTAAGAIHRFYRAMYE
jgi:ice-binding like protein